MEERRFEYQEFVKYFACATNLMSKWQIEEISKILHTVYKSKFKKSRIPKYGSMNKGFTEGKLERFFSAIDNPKFWLLFQYQATLGLRIGEVVRLNMKDINLRTRELRVDTEKAQRTDYLLIPQELFERTLEYVERYRDKIRDSDGFLFWKDTKWNRIGQKYVEDNYVGSVFQDYVVKAGLDEIYEYSNDLKNPIRRNNSQPRALHRFTTHSLRHTAITRFAKATNGNVVQASKFARHSRPDATMTYIHASKNELYHNIDKAFSNSYDKKLKRARNSGILAPK